MTTTHSPRLTQRLTFPHNREKNLLSHPAPPPPAPAGSAGSDNRLLRQLRITVAVCCRSAGRKPSSNPAAPSVGKLVCSRRREAWGNLTCCIPPESQACRVQTQSLSDRFGKTDFRWFQTYSVNWSLRNDAGQLKEKDLLRQQQAQELLPQKLQVEACHCSEIWAKDRKNSFLKSRLNRWMNQLLKR